MLILPSKCRYNYISKPFTVLFPCKHCAPCTFLCFLEQSRTLASLVFLEPHYFSCVLSDGGVHKGIDIVCGDYGIVNAPFSGNLCGPVGRAVGDSIQYDGVKLYNKGV